MAAADGMGVVEAPQAAQASPGQDAAPDARVRPEERRPAPGRAGRTSAERLHAHLGDEAQLRLGLQRRAQHNFRRHVQRAVVRFSVLVAADLVAFYLMRAMIRAVRDHALLGPTVAQGFGSLLPRGNMNGWQFAFALVLAFLVTGNYGEGDSRRNPGKLLSGCLLAAALPLWMPAWTQPVATVLVQYVMVAVLVWLGVLIERMAIDHVVDVVRPLKPTALRTLFVGRDAACRDVSAMRAFRETGEYIPLGFVEVDPEASPSRAALGSLHQLGKVIHETHAEAVVICGLLRERSFQEIIDVALASGCEVLSLPRTLALAGVRPTLVWKGGDALVTLTAPRLMAQQLGVKRVVDLVGATFGLILASPLLALLAALIKMDSHGPVLFRQERVGLGGRPFGMLKFRTMVAGAEEARDGVAHLNHTGDPRLFKIPDDPRITRIGRWLRRWSLDELPQLWNVFVGDMSLVGPRPFFRKDLALYEAHHFDRLGAKPGITGLWQVSGRSDVVDFEEVVRLDREYIETWSLWLDLRILARTLPAVFSRRGAF